jgi:hypothetical protein
MRGDGYLLTKFLSALSIVFVVMGLVAYFAISMPIISLAQESSTSESEQSIGEAPIPYYVTVQLAANGAATGIAIFAATVAFQRYNRPKLAVEKEYYPEPLPIDLEIYKIDNPLIPHELAEFNVRYMINRVVVRNNGRMAAEDCKGVLMMDGIESKLSWYIPSEIYKMNINPCSLEYLNVCAIRVEDSERILRDLQSRVSKLQDTTTDRMNQTIQLDDVIKVKKHIQEKYKSPDDFPLIISPSEAGWTSPLSTSEVKSDCAEIVITAKNSRPSKPVRVTILKEKNEHFKILKFG